jgi:hypothetical protein
MWSGEVTTTSLVVRFQSLLSDKYA